MNKKTLILIVILSLVSLGNAYQKRIIQIPKFSVIEVETQSKPFFVSYVKEDSVQYLIVIETVPLNSNNTMLEVFKLEPGVGLVLTDSELLINCKLRKCATGDFNGDNKWDLVATDMYDGAVWVWLGDGEGGIDYHGSFVCEITSLPDRVATGDFDEDEDLDIILTEWPGSNVFVMLNDGNGNFSYLGGYVYDIGGAPQELVVDDFNRDGHLDWIVATMAFNESIQMFGNGSGYFFVQQVYDIGSDGYTSSLADLDEDGINEYICGTGRDIRVFKGKGSGIFKRPGESFGWGHGPIQYRSVVGDFDGDGNQDVFSFLRGDAGEEDSQLQIWYGDGMRNLMPSFKVDIDGVEDGSYVWPVSALIDFDDKTDVIIPIINDSIVRIYLSR